MGIMSIVYGIKLLNFDQELYGFRKLYAGISIATGVCYATVLLIPLGLLVGIASNIFLAIIFFREAEMTTNHESIYRLHFTVFPLRFTTESEACRCVPGVSGS